MPMKPENTPFSTQTAKPLSIGRSERRRQFKNLKKEIGFECLDCHSIYETGYLVDGEWRCPRCHGKCRRIRLDKLKKKLEQERLKRNLI